MKPWLSLGLLSLGLHLGLGRLFWHHRQHRQAQHQIPVRIQVQPPKAPVKPAVKQVVKKQPQPQAPKAKPVLAKPQPPPKSPPPQRVQGLSRESLGSKEARIQAPLGNTLLEKDRGLRLSPDKIKPLTGDLSADPRLIASSVTKPIYTPAALDAGLEGRFIVDVFVDSQGRVIEAETANPVGYNMDAVLMKAAKQAKFHPRRDEQGRPQPAWTFIEFNLVIE